MIDVLLVLRAGIYSLRKHRGVLEHSNFLSILCPARIVHFQATKAPACFTAFFPCPSDSTVCDQTCFMRLLLLSDTQSHLLAGSCSESGQLYFMQRRRAGENFLMRLEWLHQ